MNTNGPDAGLRLWRDERGRLVYRAAPEAETSENVRVARCFPWTRRDEYVSIRDKDEKELCLLRSLDGLAAETRRLIEEELNADEFAPRITAVERVETMFDLMTWKVRTASGPVELQVRQAEDVRQLDSGGVLIRDHAGGTFQIENVAELDARSRSLVEEHLG